MSYSKEKLSRAVYTLATSSETIQNRLISCGRYCLQRLAEEQFWHKQSEQYIKFQEIYKQMTAKGPGTEDEGSFYNTLKDLSNEECEKIAEAIYDLQLEL